MVETFSSAMIEEFMTRRDIRYRRDGDTRFVATFSPHAERPYELNVHLSAEENDVYVVRVLVPHYYRAEEGPALLALVNRWHRERRWPKVYLDPTGDATFVRLVAESYVALSRGIHQDGIDEFSMIAMTTADQFFCWIEASYQPVQSPAPGVDADELESWLREAS